MNAVHPGGFASTRPLLYGTPARLLTRLLQDAAPIECVPYQALIEAVWPDEACDAQARHRLGVTVHMLRGFLADEFIFDAIHTVYGRGYVLAADAATHATIARART